MEALNPKALNEGSGLTSDDIKVLRTFEFCDGRSRSEIASLTGFDESRVSYSLTHLSLSDLIERIREKPGFYRIRPEGSAVLEELKFSINVMRKS
jgi:DNA-binding MarR family transcriptional regulator